MNRGIKMEKLKALWDKYNVKGEDRVKMKKLIMELLENE